MKGCSWVISSDQGAKLYFGEIPSFDLLSTAFSIPSLQFRLSAGFNFINVWGGVAALSKLTYDNPVNFQDKRHIEVFCHFCLSVTTVDFLDSLPLKY